MSDGRNPRFYRLTKRDTGPYMTFEDICARLSGEPWRIVDRDVIKRMTRRYVATVLFRQRNKDGGIDPTGKQGDVSGKIVGMDYIGLLRGIPREYWPQYGRLMAGRQQAKKR